MGDKPWPASSNGSICSRIARQHGRVGLSAVTPSLGVFLNKTSGNNPSSRRAPQQTESLLDNRVSDLRGSGVAMRLISIGNNTSNRNTQAALTFAQTVCVGKMA
jgi:hypothetical protein